MEILESNTQNNLKSISDDLHFVNNTVLEHHNVLGSQESQNSNLNSQIPRQQSEVAGSETVENRTEVEVGRENMEGREDVQEGSPQERESGERSTAAP